MVRNARAAKLTALSSAAAIRLRRRSPSETALMVAQFVFVGLTATLFFIWLTGGDRRVLIGETLSTHADCLGSGRGAVCASRFGEDEASEPMPGCASLGRGGLVCESESNRRARGVFSVSVGGPLSR